MTILKVMLVVAVTRYIGYEFIIKQQVKESKAHSDLSRRAENI